MKKQITSIKKTENQVGRFSCFIKNSMIKYKNRSEVLQMIMSQLNCRTEERQQWFMWKIVLA